jgi:hypothetical protein
MGQRLHPVGFFDSHELRVGTDSDGPVSSVAATLAAGCPDARVAREAAAVAK